MSGFVVGGDGVAQDYDAWCATEFGPQIGAQAWSQAEPPAMPAHRDRASWWRVGGLSAAILALAALVCGAVVVGSSHTDEHNAWPPGYTSPPTATTPPADPDTSIVMPPPFTMPPDVPVARITQDGEYMHKLYLAGYDASSDRTQAILFAHQTCRYLSYPDASIGTYALVEQVEHPMPYGVSGYQVISRVAAQVYCPERL